jgi:hypothetical protein
MVACKTLKRHRTQPQPPLLAAVLIRRSSLDHRVRQLLRRLRKRCSAEHREMQGLVFCVLLIGMGLTMIPLINRFEGRGKVAIGWIIVLCLMFLGSWAVLKGVEIAWPLG